MILARLSRPRVLGTTWPHCYHPHPGSCCFFSVCWHTSCFPTYFPGRRWFHILILAFHATFYDVTFDVLPWSSESNSSVLNKNKIAYYPECTQGLKGKGFGYEHFSSYCLCRLWTVTMKIRLQKHAKTMSSNSAPGCFQVNVTKWITNRIPKRRTSFRCQGQDQDKPYSLLTSSIFSSKFLANVRTFHEIEILCFHVKHQPCVDS